MGQIPVGAYNRTILQNGLPVLMFKQRSLPLVYIYLLIKGGSSSDTSGKEGLAFLTASMLKKGTKSRSLYKLVNEIESLGGYLQSSAGKDYSYISAEYLSKNFIDGLELFTDVLYHPVFEDKEIVKEKRQIIGQIYSYYDNPQILATLFFSRFLFGSHPYAKPVSGTEKTVQAIEHKQILQFYQSHYIPNNSILAVVGDIDDNSHNTEIESLFESWERKSLPKNCSTSADNLEKMRIIIIDKPDVTQSQIRIGRLGINRRHPDYFAIKVANTIFGGSFTSRLVDQVRVNRGLTYNINSRFSAPFHKGEFKISTFTKIDKTEETIRIILEEMEKFCEESLDNDTIRNTKQYLIGQFTTQIETADDIARHLADIEFYQMPKDYLSEYVDKIKNITTDDIKRVLKENFCTDNLLILVLSKGEKIKKSLEKFGPVEVYPFENDLLD